MAERPSIQIARLLLRPFVLADAPEVQRLAGEKDIAAMTLAIPHPPPFPSSSQEGEGEDGSLALAYRTKTLET